MSFLPYVYESVHKRFIFMNSHTHIYIIPRTYTANCRFWSNIICATKKIIASHLSSSTKDGAFGNSHLKSSNADGNTGNRFEKKVYSSEYIKMKCRCNNVWVKFLSVHTIFLPILEVRVSLNEMHLDVIFHDSLSQLCYVGWRFHVCYFLCFIISSIHKLQYLEFNSIWTKAKWSFMIESE